ncbi:MAG: nitrous oxide reductase family maturation protein NosD [Rhodocyclaceae bacterium]|nr:nitrous oxide reductase family maturation protein NosD [Rhodocyclaceae bacterium]
MRLAYLLLCFALPALAAPQLQPLIDATPAGGLLRLPPGRYDGPAVIARPLTLDGGGRATLDGGGRGIVLTLRASGATVRGMALTGSGATLDGMDAAIEVAGDDNRIEDNLITDALFGIHIRQGNRNRVLNNRVRGKDLPLGLRGDGLRLWNSRYNVVSGNEFTHVRDLTLANSPDNRILGNRLDDARYGMHIIFSPRSFVADNRISHTATGIVVLYSDDVTLHGNTIAHVFDGGGAGIVFKDSATGLIEDNDVIHCAAGLLANTPRNDELALTIRRNRFAHNIVGMSFYGAQGGHRILANRFEHNLTQVVVSSPDAGSANAWQGNHWSDYQGFDRDSDGVGDTPYELYSYTDRIWMEIPRAKFFANAPALELLDFLERLAPFLAPSLILRDATPQMR